MSKKTYRQKVEVLVFKNGKVCVCVPSGGRNIYNFPGGGVDEGEGFSEAAQRECLEEVGIAIVDVVSLRVGDIFTSGTKASAMGFDGTQVSYYSGRFHKEDKSLFNKEGDARRYEWMTIDEAIEVFNKPDSIFDMSRKGVLAIVKAKNLHR